MTTAAFWDKAAEKYAKDPISDMESYTQTLDIMKDLLQPQHRVLEIGCGTGSTALELAPQVDRYVGTDISSNMVEIAADKLADTNLDHLSFQVAQAHEFPGTGHDVVLALNLLHLVENMEETLGAIYNALPSGGIFISKSALLGEGSWYLGPMIALMRAVGKAPFVARFSEAELIRMMERAGFTITQTIKQGGMAPRLFVVAQKP